MTKYVVMCERDEDEPPIFLIDDDRAGGGRVRVQSNRTDVKLSRASHRGGSVTTHSTCGGPCGRRLDLSDATIGHLLDSINVAALATTSIAAREPVADPGAVTAWQAERHREILAELTGTGSAPVRSDIPMTAGVPEIRYVIPFGALCHQVSKLPKDR